MRTSGAGFGGKVRSTACEVEDEQVGGLSCFSYPLGSIGSRSAAEEPPEDGVSTLSPAKPKAGEIYIDKNDSSANGKTSTNAWCGKGLALKAFIITFAWVMNT